MRVNFKAVIHFLRMQVLEVLCNCIVQCIRMRCTVRVHHWQASQPTSSIAVNFTSVAGAALMGADEADASCALMPPAGMPDDTALCEPALTVDFSTCVALVVRR